MINVDQRLVGLAVSGVSDVIALADEEIRTAPDLGERAIAAAVSGIVERALEDGTPGTVLLLDVPHLMRRIREGRA